MDLFTDILSIIFIVALIIVIAPMIFDLVVFTITLLFQIIFAVFVGALIFNVLVTLFNMGRSEEKTWNFAH